METITPYLELLGTLLAGVFGSYITQGIKKMVEVTGLSALMLTYIVSAVLGFIVAVMTDSWDVNDIMTSMAYVFTLSQFVYRALISRDSVVPTTTTTTTN